ncbi:MAG TPA: carbohydrate kinase family protein [Bacteroidota bacterium]|nr:carbohydrate kinase family protein [Bacteroidota bacterium]
MRILVLGHLSIDRWHGKDGSMREEWGGIANAIGILGSIAGKGDSVIPVSGISKADHERFCAWVAAFAQVETAGVYVTDGPTNAVDFYEQKSGIRVACAQSIASPVPFERARKFLGVDGILINMASGSDITLDTLDQIRMEVRPKSTPIHLDYHNLTTAVGEDRQRVARPLPEWRRWAFMISNIQLNEKEAAGLTVEGLGEEKLAGHLLTLGSSCVVITRGGKGATLYLNDRKKVLRRDALPPAAAEAADPTGLGDIFGAAFFYESLRSADPVRALQFAQHTASVKAPLARSARWARPAADEVA